MKAFVFVFMLVVMSCALDLTSAARKKWDGLRVTWGMNPKTNPNLFVKYPRTEAEASNQGYRKISDCDLRSTWRGKRYIKNDDYLLMLLYDVNGYIAGLQTKLTEKESTTYPPKSLQPPFLPDEGGLTITAYFTDPAKICSTGRSAQEFETEGTGTNLYIQNSTNPEESLLIPPYKSDVVLTKWSEGKCLPVMGIHFYHNLYVEKPCEEIFPAVLLYNEGQLTAFAWTFLANITSIHFEYPRSNVYANFMVPVPRCMYNYPLVTTMHVYLTDNVFLNRC